MLIGVGADGCSSLFGDNPQSCVHHPEICDSESACNPIRVACQPRVLGILGGSEKTNENLRYGLSGPMGVYLYEDIPSTKLIVADTGNSRVLIWNTVPTTNVPPDVVLGQPTLDTGEAFYAGGSLFAMYAPQSVTVIDGKLIVGDTGANRILIWNKIPSSNFQNADLVWGQPNATARTANQGKGSATALPTGVSFPFVSSEGPNLLVTEALNHRVIRFKGVPTKRTDMPDRVLGQSNFTNNDITQKPSSSTLSKPIGTSAFGKVNLVPYIFVPDTSSNRVLGFNVNSINAIDNTNMSLYAAEILIGQSSDSIASSGSSASALNTPNSALATEKHLWVADEKNDRVLAFELKTLPLQPKTPPPSAVILLNDGPPPNGPNRYPPTKSTLSRPRGIAATSKYFAVADSGNNRILLWNGDPDQITSNREADIVIGQPTAPEIPLGSTGIMNARRAIDEKSLNSPASIAGYGNRLIVADTEHNRVLIWTLKAGEPTVIESAVMLGKNAPYRCLNSSIDAGCLDHPLGVATTSNGSLLAVADTKNHRVLIWNGVPTVNGVAANSVLGQDDISKNSVNRGKAVDKLVGTEFSSPSAVRFINEYLMVSDSGNNRILSFPITASKDTSPVAVIGQPAVSLTAEASAPDGLHQPIGLSHENGQLYVADTLNHRVLGFALPITPNGPEANLILGDFDYLDGAAERPAANSMNTPTGVLVTADHLFVSDTMNNRLLQFKKPLGDGQSATWFMGQPNPDTGVSKPNNGGMSKSSLNQPSGLYMNDDAIFVADTGNNRILVLSRWQ